MKYDLVYVAMHFVCIAQTPSKKINATKAMIPIKKEIFEIRSRRFSFFVCVSVSEDSASFKFASR
jgi:hypothetical protein